MFKNLMKSIRRNRLTFILFLLFLIYIGYTLINQEVRIKELRSDREEIISSIDEMNLEIEKLVRDIENSHSLEYIEKLAREKLKLVRPNEIIYIIENTN